jgi:hypothetical protein
MVFHFSYDLLNLFDRTNNYNKIVLAPLNLNLNVNFGFMQIYEVIYIVCATTRY